MCFNESVDKNTVYAAQSIFIIIICLFYYSCVEWLNGVMKEFFFLFFFFWKIPLIGGVDRHPPQSL